MFLIHFRNIPDPLRLNMKREGLILRKQTKGLSNHQFTKLQKVQASRCSTRRWVELWVMHYFGVKPTGRLFKPILSLPGFPAWRHSLFVPHTNFNALKLACVLQLMYIFIVWCSLSSWKAVIKWMTCSPVDGFLKLGVFGNSCVIKL